MACPALDTVTPLFEKYCYSCHGPEKQKADLALHEMALTIRDATDALHWQDILDQLNAGEMPPDEPQPSAEDLAQAIGTITDALHEARQQFRTADDAAVLRRLNRREYHATVEELLGVQINIDDLPKPHGGAIDTVGSQQTFRARDLESYYETGLELAAMALYWATQPRLESTVVREEGKDRNRLAEAAYEVYQKLDEMKATGKSREEVGLTQEQFNRFSPTVAGNGSGVYQLYRKYWERNEPLMDRGTMMAHVGGIGQLQVYVPLDPRARYEVRAALGVREDAGRRRSVRLTDYRDKVIGATMVSGTLDAPEEHHFSYRPSFPVGYRGRVSDDGKPVNVNPFRYHTGGYVPKVGDNFLVLFSEDTGAPHRIFNGFYETGTPEETIFGEWMEVEGPIYDPPSRFELLLKKHVAYRRPESVTITDVETFLTRFGNDLFRGREVPVELLSKLVGVFEMERADGRDVLGALEKPVALLLASPRFLYLNEPPSNEGEEELDGLALASRLSYFLWSSPPDAKLYHAAKNGNLTKPGALRAHAVRMLDDLRARRFHEGFISQWAHLERFDSLNIDAGVLPEFSPGYRFSAREEPIHFFARLIRENLGVRHWIDSDVAVVNRLLAGRYGLPLPKTETFEPVVLPSESPRGGFLTQAAFLASGTMGNRTSPVIRGSLIREIFLDDPPPPPPPNVPELEIAGSELRSVRHLVELHQTRAQCASCHTRIDPLGLGLEHFDTLGFWRESEVIDNGIRVWNPARREAIFEIDDAGSLPNGESFRNLAEMKDLLLERQDRLARSLLEALMTYAYGRTVGFADREQIDAILTELADSGDSEPYRMRDMILAVIASEPFREP